jgi:magnesium chelatase family protein
VEVTPVTFDEIASEQHAEKSGNIRNRVIAARTRQTHRFKDTPNMYCNAQMGSKQLRKVCKIDTASQQMLKTAMERLNLSARAYDRILKVARTIADLDDSPDIAVQHLSEAIQYRNLDRDQWRG